MRRQRGLVGLTGLAALVGLGVVAKPAMSAVTTEKSASILVFPKVIANGTRDTIIQITNTSNNVQHAHCFYVDGQPGSAGPVCQEVDFDIWLTKQQPTHWVVSKGRLVASETYNCSVPCVPSTVGTAAANCCDSGLDPGHIPPAGPGFTGELFCVLTDAGDSPYPGNAIKGEATLEDLATGDVSKYNGIGLVGYNSLDSNNVLCLGPDGATSASCPSREYEACPDMWYLDHASTGAADSAEGSPPFFSVQPNITLVPCTLNLESQTPTSVTLQFDVINEFELHLSASTTVTCWASWNLGASTNGVNPITFNALSNFGTILQTRVRSAAPQQVPPQANGGVLIVVEETHSFGYPTVAFTAKSAQNGHTSFADHTGLDIVTIPADQLYNGPQP